MLNYLLFLRWVCIITKVIISIFYIKGLKDLSFVSMVKIIFLSFNKYSTGRN
jgi:hypothetical protein